MYLTTSFPLLFDCIQSRLIEKMKVTVEEDLIQLIEFVPARKFDESQNFNDVDGVILRCWR